MGLPPDAAAPVRVPVRLAALGADVVAAGVLVVAALAGAMVTSVYWYGPLSHPAAAWVVAGLLAAAGLWWQGTRPATPGMWFAGVRFGPSGGFGARLLGRLTGRGLVPAVGDPGIVRTVAGIAGGVMAGPFTVLLLLGWGFFAGQPPTGQEAATHSAVLTLRSAIHIYEVDMDGRRPASLDAPDFVPKYLPEVPAVKLRHLGHALNRVVEVRAFLRRDGTPLPGALRDSGHWLYDPATGMITVDCTHMPVGRLRSRGECWTWGLAE